MSLHSRKHETGNWARMRVWRNEWASDQFEILEHGDYALLERACTELGMPIVRHHCQTAAECNCGPDEPSGVVYVSMLALLRGNRSCTMDQSTFRRLITILNRLGLHHTSIITPGLMTGHHDW